MESMSINVVPLLPSPGRLVLVFLSGGTQDAHRRASMSTGRIRYSCWFYNPIYISYWIVLLQLKVSGFRLGQRPTVLVVNVKMLE